MHSHNQTGPMANPPRAVDSGVKESLEGVLEEMDEGCGQDDACAKVLSYEEDDAGYANALYSFGQRREPRS